MATSRSMRSASRWPGSRPPTGAPLTSRRCASRRSGGTRVTTGRSASNWPTSSGSLPCQSARPKPPSAGPLSQSHPAPAWPAPRPRAGPLARQEPSARARSDWWPARRRQSGPRLLWTGSTSDGAARSGNSRIGPCCALPGGAMPISADATTAAAPSRHAVRRREGRITLDQRGKVSSGRTRSTRGRRWDFPGHQKYRAAQHQHEQHDEKAVDRGHRPQRCPSLPRRKACLQPGSPLYMPMRDAVSTSGQESGSLIA